MATKKTQRVPVAARAEITKAIREEKAERRALRKTSVASAARRTYYEWQETYNAALSGLLASGTCESLFTAIETATKAANMSHRREMNAPAPEYVG